MPKLKKKLYDPNSEDPYYFEEQEKPKKLVKNRRKLSLWQIRKKQGAGFWQADIGLEDE